LARLGRTVEPSAADDLLQKGITACSLTQSGVMVMMGTPDYMAPEQALNFHGADARADLYGLGCTLYYLLAGQPPFAGGTLGQKLMRHQQYQPPPLEGIRPDVPAALLAVLARLLAKRPEERYATASEVAQALAPLADGVAGPAGPEAPRRASRRWLVGLAAALLSAATVCALPLADALVFPKRSPTAADQPRATPQAVSNPTDRTDRTAPQPAAKAPSAAPSATVARRPQPAAQPRLHLLEGADIGKPSLHGKTSYDTATGTYTIAAGGTDIWAGEDQFHFAYQSWKGDGTLIARVVGQTNTSERAKAGIMFRDSKDPNATFIDLVVTPSDDAHIQWRDRTGNHAQDRRQSPWITSPAWLKLVRRGAGVSAYFSFDGMNWTQIGKSQEIVFSKGTILAGLAVTAHTPAKLNTATFTDFSLAP